MVGGQDLLSRVTGLGGPAPWSSVYLMALFLETRITRPNRKATDREQINSECIKNTKGRRRRKRKKKGSTDDKPKKNEKRPCENLGAGGNEGIDQKKLRKETKEKISWHRIAGLEAKFIQCSPTKDILRI